MQLISWVLKKRPQFTCLALCLVCLTVFPTFVYYQTKDSYYAVGFNNGSIDARHELIETIIHAARKIYGCGEIKNKRHFVLVINVKTESLHLFRTEHGYQEFCLYR